MNVRSQALNREQMEEDFDYLWRMLEEEYPLYGTAERLYDKDYQVTKEAYREKLAELENDAEFCKVIERCIESFRGCGHLKMLNTGVLYRDGLLDPTGEEWCQVSVYRRLLCAGR